MKLAAGYIVFDGLETLEASIRSIRSNVDTIIVSYQTVSWSGTRASATLVQLLHDLRKKKLIDHVLEFTKFRPSSLVSQESVMMAKSFEMAKRQSCLDLAKSVGATHYMSIDADEFYRESELAWAKSQIEEQSLEATALHYINYVTPTLHRGHSRWKIPFIYKITPNCRHHSLQQIFSGIDPTRGLLDETYQKSRIFERGLISMHHMEMVRHDIAGKYQASSRFFENRENLHILESDVIASRTSGELMFTKIHLGDSENAREVHKLISCENEFGIKF